MVPESRVAMDDSCHHVPRMERLENLLRKLRSPDGCPWDRAQTPQSLIPFLVEEVHELVDAITTQDESRIREELGDILLHLLFQVQLAEERGAFAWGDVVTGICEKMESRHRHILNGDGPSDRSGETWETSKRKEKDRDSLLDGIPGTLPALLRSWRVQQRAAEVGFDWPDAASVWEKVHEEMAELEQEFAAEDSTRIADELGDLLFVLVSFGRHHGLVAENVLQSAMARFSRRFREMERELAQRGSPIGTVPLAVMDAMWEKIKSAEKRGEEEHPADHKAG